MTHGFFYSLIWFYVVLNHEQAQLRWKTMNLLHFYDLYTEENKLLSLKYRRIPQRWIEWCRYAETLRVEISSYFHGITRLAAVSVFVWCRFQKESVFSFWISNPFYPFSHGFNKIVIVEFHKFAHFSECWNLWHLQCSQFFNGIFTNACIFDKMFNNYSINSSFDKISFWIV